MITGLMNNDEYDLSIDYPYYAIVLTPEEVEKVKDCKLVVYHVDGREMIDIRDKGKFTGEKILFIMFMPKEENKK